VGLALTSSVAFADVPDQSNCEVSPADALNGLVFCPLLPAAIPASVNLITVRNSSNNPIPNASVVVTVTGTTTLCSATVLTGTTNASGQVTLTLGGGGCAHNVALSGIIKANGVTIRSYSNVKSPDYDGASGSLLVDLSDFISFKDQFLDAAPNECHDYDNNGDTDLGDLIIFSAPFNAGNSCP
jgi:hypothetical protein